MKKRKNKVTESNNPVEIASTPEWHKRGEHLNHDTRTEEERLADQKKFEAKRQEIFLKYFDNVADE